MVFFRNKKKLFYGFFLIILVSAYIPTGLYAADDWKLVKNEDGVELYSRPHKDSGINEYKSVVTIPASFDVLYAIISYTPLHKKLIHTCYDANIVKPWNKGRQNNYFILKAPWPLRDRDLIYDSRGHIDPDSGNLIVVCKAVKEPLVPIDKYVRIMDSEQMWILEKLGPDKTRVSYFNYTDPSIPAVPNTFINSITQDIPYYSLINMRNLAKDPIFKKLALKYHIEEDKSAPNQFFLQTLFP